MRFAASLKFGERRAFKSTKHSAADMLVSDCTEKHYLFDAVRHRRKLNRNGQEVSRHVVLSMQIAKKEGVCEA